MLWLVETADGTWRRGEILFGECILLFTSLDTLHTFVAACEDREEAKLRPAVFSRNRKEFGRRARQAVQQGVIGALIDPAPDAAEAPFLQFGRLAR